MEPKTFTTIDHEEFSGLIAGLFGWGSADEPYSVVADLSANDPRWGNDTSHVFYAEIDPELFDEEMDHELKVITANGRIQYSHQLTSVVKCLVKSDLIPIGNVLIEVNW